MAIHISRDFSQKVVTGANSDAVIVYLTALFLRRVLGFTVVGETNMDIDGDYLQGSGTSADVNLGSGLEWWVEIDSGEYSIVSSDVDRILVLQSASYPRYNSGLFRILAVDTINNRVRIDYRSADYPPTETNLPWAIYDAEDDVSYSNSGNGSSTEYRTQGAGASASRIILQSPDPSGWQVRLTREDTDSQGDIGGVATTVAPGFGGDSLGDFQERGEHLHNQQWYNDRTVREGLTCGIGLNDQDDGIRYYFWGDDTTGSTILVGRDAGGSTNGWCLFGLPEAEETPAPPLNVQRLFVIGDCNSTQITINWTGGRRNTNSNHSGCAYGRVLQPVSCVMGTYTYLADNQNSSDDAYIHRGRTQAADNPMTGRTELQSVDLFAGTWDNMDVGSSGPGEQQLDSRRLGRVPIARLGRDTYGSWTTSPESTRDWFHLFNGVWLPWEGPKTLP